MTPDPRLGLTALHRRYVPHSAAHYGGGLVDAAYVLSLFGEVATEVCIRSDGDEGLFASYADVQFVAPVRGGDVIEVTATVTRVGARSRDLDLTARIICRADTAGSGSGAKELEPPLTAVTARGTVVVPAVPSGGSR